MAKDENQEPEVVIVDDKGREVVDDPRGQPDGRRARRASLTDRSDSRSAEPRTPNARSIEDDRPTERQTRMKRRLAALNRQMADKDARIAMLEGDLRLTTGRLAESNKSAMTHYEAAAKARVEHWTEKLQAAHEAGDGKAISEATRHLSSAQFALDNCELSKANAPAEQRTQRTQQTQPAATQRTQNSAATQAWIDDHPWFNTDPGARQMIGQIHNKVVAEGFTPDTDEYFDEVERRAATVLPEGYIEQPQGDLDDEIEHKEETPAPRPRTSRQAPDDFAEHGEQRAPVAGVRRAASASRNGPSQIRLTREEAEVCATAGITPAQFYRHKMKLAEEGKIGPGVR